jgi:hypothetical protein
MSWERVNAIINYLTEKEGISVAASSSAMVSRLVMRTLLISRTEQARKDLIQYLLLTQVEKKRINNYSIIETISRPSDSIGGSFCINLNGLPA